LQLSDNKQTLALRQASEESAYFLLRRLTLASMSIFHSYRPQRWLQVNQSHFIDGETSFAFSNASSVL